MSDQKVWQKALGQNEQIKYEFGIGKRFRIMIFICFMIFGIPLLFVVPWIAIIVTILALLLPWYLNVANKYAFTDKRALIHRGWLSTRLISVDYDKITDIYVEEPFLDRVLTKTGHLAINTAGTSVQEVVLKHIEKPYEAKKKIDQIREGD